MIIKKPIKQNQKPRDLAITALENNFHLTVERKYGRSYIHKDGVDYEAKVHNMPYVDKCIIVDYNDLVSRQEEGMIFINTKTDFQDVAYMVKDRQALRQEVDRHLARVTPNDWIWMSKLNEKKLYGDNTGFVGITIKVSDLVHSGLAEVIRKYDYVG